VVAQFATAALIVLTLGLGFVIFGSGRLSLERSLILPVPTEAPSVAGTPTTEAQITTLFSTTLKADQIPRESNLHFVLWRLSLAPGDGFPAWTQSQACCSGPQFTHVLEGELTVHATGEMEVVRSSQNGSDVLRPSPGEEVVAGPGDTIVHDFAFPAAYTVRGTNPVQIVNAGLFAGTMPSPWLRHSGYLGGSSEVLDGQLPAGPMSVTLIRGVLPPHGEIHPPPLGSLVLATGDTDKDGVGKQSDGALFNPSDRTETVFAAILESSGKPSLTP
jgi:hypothetical protein